MYVTTVIGILYGIYVILVFTLIAWFSYAVTSKKKIKPIFKFSLEAWIVFLIIAAVTFHVMTFLKLPWVRWEFMGQKLVPVQEFNIDIKDYEFNLPQKPIMIKKNEPVKFNLTSQDVTYGFGIFRENGTLVFQIQVVPSHNNEITWIFKDTGKYTIRSTEYSGPENWKMVLKDSIIIQE